MQSYTLINKYLIKVLNHALFISMEIQSILKIKGNANRAQPAISVPPVLRVSPAIRTFVHSAIFAQGAIPQQCAQQGLTETNLD